jgi:hypothetical protein
MRESVASAKVHDVELGKARATKPTTTHAMKTLNQSTAALAAFLAALVSAHAAPVINGNFCSVANIQDPPAGLVSGSSAWNDLTSTTGGYSASDTSYGSLNAGASPPTSAPTNCATPSQPTCSTPAPTSAASKASSAMPASQQPKSTPT